MYVIIAVCPWLNKDAFTLTFTPSVLKYTAQRTVAIHGGKVLAQGAQNGGIRTVSGLTRERGTSRQTAHTSSVSPAVNDADAVFVLVLAAGLGAGNHERRHCVRQQDRLHAETAFGCTLLCRTFAELRISF